MLVLLTALAVAQQSSRALHEEVQAVADAVDVPVWVQPPSRKAALALILAADGEREGYRLAPARWSAEELAIRMAKRRLPCALRLLPDDRGRLEVRPFGDCSPGVSRPDPVDRESLWDPEPPDPWRPSPGSPFLEHPWRVWPTDDGPELRTSMAPVALVPAADALEALGRRPPAVEPPRRVLVAGLAAIGAGAVIAPVGIAVECSVGDALFCGIASLAVGSAVAGTGVLTAAIGGIWTARVTRLRRRPADVALDPDELRQAQEAHRSALQLR